jgi:uncharacterized membrane protein
MEVAPFTTRSLMHKDKLRPALSVFMAGVGILHFTHAPVFMSIMPAYLPWHRELVLLSGAIEITLGVMLALERTRVLAAWGLMALFVAVFPANLNMALHPELTIVGAPTWLPKPTALASWLRLPFQLVLIYWAYLYMGKAEPVLQAKR